MERVAAGDETAFRLLVDRWEAPILSFLTRTLGDREEARDLAQETFLRVFRHAARYQGGGRFRSWIFRIAGNLTRSRLRRRRVVKWLSLGAKGTPLEPAGPRHQESDTRLESEELGRAIEACLAELPPRQRTAFALKRFEGLSYREIAEAMDTSPSAVESLLVRATREMQRGLRQRGFGEDD